MVFSKDICWEYPVTDFYGYGRFKNKKIHREFFKYIHNVELTKKDFICHLCSNKSCFNPHHLYLGDAKTNAMDEVNRGAKKTTNEKIRKKLLGIKHTDERRKNQSEAQKRLYESGYINPKKGIPSKPNKGSFGNGREAPLKGRKRVIIDGKIKFIKT